MAFPSFAKLYLVHLNRSFSSCRYSHQSFLVKKPKTHASLWSHPCLLLGLPLLIEVVSILYCNTLGHMVDFVDADQPLSKLKHIVSQADDNELCILGSFLDITSND